ncbi:MAG: NTP transferase domain-containing protein [Candidatus Blackburnbacteria bacterium]|nr:NTP transferase domain-containing protein [Candidatus Blackburnbacteria bacterium]
MKDREAIILAGGKGSRMKSELPKVLHKLANKPIVFWTIETLKNAGIEQIVIVTGYRSELIKKEVQQQRYKKIGFVRQKTLLGTGNAVEAGLQRVPDRVRYAVIIFGDDSGLYRPDTIKALIENHIRSGSPMTILTTYNPASSYLGGLERNQFGDVVGVLSGRQIQEKKIKQEIVCGAFCFDREWLAQNITKIPINPTSGEYGLPSLIKIAASQGRFANTFELPDPNEWTSVNTQEELQYADQLKVKQIRV